MAGYTSTNVFGSSSNYPSAAPVFGASTFGNLSSFGSNNAATASTTPATPALSAQNAAALDAKAQCAKGLFTYRSNDVHIFKFPGPYQVRLEALDRHMSRLYVTDANGNEQSMLENVKVNLLCAISTAEGVTAVGGKLIIPVKCIGNSFIINAYDDYEVLVDGNQAITLCSVIQHRFVTSNGVACSRMAM